MNHPTTIKTRQLRRIAELLEPLKQTLGIREIKRTRNLTLLAHIRPAIHFTAGQEVELAKDIRGRTYQYPLGIKIIAEKADPEWIDTAVGAVQNIIESNLQLDDLCHQIDGGTENPFLDAPEGETGGSIILYDVTYRRELAHPENTY